MRGKRRHRFQGKKTRDVCDFTIDDFANSPVSNTSGRLKKPIRNILRGVDYLSAKEQNKELLDSLEENGEDWKKEVVKSSRRKTKMDFVGGIPEEAVGVRYPLDVWYLISKYIDPESVGKFASLCHDANAVVETAGFWKSMYKRYYRKDADLPQALQPHILAQRCGLRIKVVRALHHLYRPLSLKTNTHPSPLSIMLRRMIVSQWYQTHESGHWMFYLKLKEQNNSNGLDNGYRKSAELFDDVSYNSEKGCVIIQIICSQYVQMPVIMGKIVREVNCFRIDSSPYHLQLKCNASYTSSIPTLSIDVRPVINILILNWWNPMYPQSQWTLPLQDDSDEE